MIARPGDLEASCAECRSKPNACDCDLVTRATDIPGDGLLQVHAVYRKWFGEHYDTGTLDTVLCAAAAEKLSGDPPWLLVVGGSGAAKTETIAPLGAVGAHMVSTITGEAALLSATPQERRSKAAHGGLLKAVGTHGLVVIKDFTSILSMHRDTRAAVLAALREIYDGHWTRNVGTDGGMTFSWHGRIVVIGAVTTAWDAHHQVVATMGDRFLLVRYRGDERRAAGRQAIKNVSHETTMRDELREAVRTVLSAAAGKPEPGIDDSTVDELLTMADLVTRCRTPVERDFQGNPAFAHALEMPTRFAKQLVQLVRGGLALGMSHERAMAVAIRAARDSMPPQRLAVLADVDEHAVSRTAQVARRLRMPWRSTDRALQELQLLGCLLVDEDDGDKWVYTVEPEMSDVVKSIARNVTTTPEG
jgi:hypothetical protein